MPITKITNKALSSSQITSDKIVDNTIVNADISPSAAIADAKAPGLSSVSTTLTNACASVSDAKFNVSLLGFKMAVN